MDWLKCNICFNIYNDSGLRPRSLNCGHTFCERCLNNTIQNKSLTCPQCRKIHEIQSAADLPINFIVEGLLKSLNPSSQELKEGTVLIDLGGKDNTNDNSSEACISLKSHLEEQEKSLLAQKELRKTSAGLCNEHPSTECMFRCSVHKSWVCEKCTEEQGDHPINKCKIITFANEIEDRKQEYMKSLIDDGNLCDETKTQLEKHMDHLKDVMEDHTCLIDSLQELVKIHKKEKDSLEREMKIFHNMIETNENIKHKFLNAEKTVTDSETLDESNAAKDIVKSYKVESTDWINAAKKEVKAGKLKLEKSTSSALATNFSLECRGNCELLQEELDKDIFESDEIEKNAKLIKSRYDEFVRNPLFLTLTSDKLASLVGFLGIYATYTHNNTQRWGHIISCDGGVLLQDFRNDLPYNDALVMNLNDVRNNIPRPRVVYMNFSSGGKDLGRIVIKVNEKAQSRAQQLVDLCLGQKGLAYAGSNDISLGEHGTPDERIVIGGYLHTSKQRHIDKKLYKNLEISENIVHRQGLVVINSPDCADFRILTKSNPKQTWQGPAIGEVVEGFPTLEKIVEVLSNTRYKVHITSCHLRIRSC